MPWVELLDLLGLNFPAFCLCNASSGWSHWAPRTEATLSLYRKSHQRWEISTREDCCWELESLKLSKLAWEHNDICIWDSPKVCLARYPALVSDQSQILKHKHWETERKQKYWKILQRWVKFCKTTHTVRFMDYILSRRRFRKYMSTCYPASRSEYALPALQASVCLASAPWQCSYTVHFY